MKITLDIPDNTVAAIVNILWGDFATNLTMQGHSIITSDLYDGAAITIKAKKGE